ncbi:MAG: hypothetical protein WCL54_07905 [Clostridia bacterium]
MERKFRVPKKDDDFDIFSIRMSRSLIEKTDEIARKTNRSRNDVVNLCVAFATENFEEEIYIAEKPQKPKGPKVY